MATPPPPGAAVPPTSRRLVVLATFLAAILRLGHLATVATSTIPRWHWVEIDSDYAFLWQWAGAIRSGNWLSEGVVPNYVEWMRRAAPWEDWLRWYHGGTGYPQAPLYAYLVALFGQPPEGSPVAVLLFQSVLATAAVPFVYALGRRWGGTELAGLCAAFLFAACQVTVALDGFMLRDSVAISIAIFALAMLERIRSARRPWLPAMAAGLLLGVGALQRENLLLLGVVAVGLAAWLHAQRAEVSDLKARARTAAVLLASLSLVLVPLVVRNVSLGASPLYLGRSGPEIIILGLCLDRDCDAIGHAIPARLGELMERSGGTVLGSLKTMLEDARGREGALAKLMLRRLWGLLSPYEGADNVDLDYLVLISPALKLTVPTGVFIPLSLAGLVLACRRWRQCAVALVAVATLGAVIPLIPVLWRLRAGLSPVMVPLAGVALAEGLHQLRFHRARGIAWAAAFAASLALMYRFPPKPLFRIRHIETVSAAQVHLLDDDVDGALLEIETFGAQMRLGRVEQRGIPIVAELRQQLLRRKREGAPGSE